MESTSEIREKEPGGYDGYHDYRQISCHGRSVIGTVSGHGRRWFVKSLVPPLADSTPAIRSLRKEFDILLGLNHPGIVRVIEFTEIPGVGPSIIMEYLEGRHLDEAVRKMKASQKREVASQLLEAVGYIHQKGVTHGDLKPENIIVSGGTSPRLTLIDFNLADSGEYCVDKEAGGNRKYAAPEQFEKGYRLQPSADVYSLGKLLYELNLGRGWRRPVRKAMAQNPADRYPDAGTFKSQLQRSKNTARLYLIFSTLLLLVLIIAYFSLFHDERPETRQASMDNPADTAAASVITNTGDTSVISPTYPEQKMENEALPNDASAMSNSNERPQEKGGTLQTPAPTQSEDFIRLDNLRKQTEKEVLAIFEKSEKEIEALAEKSELSSKEKKRLITYNSLDANKRAYALRTEFMKECPSEYIVNPPEEWKDLIGMKYGITFLQWVISVKEGI